MGRINKAHRLDTSESLKGEEGLRKQCREGGDEDRCVGVHVKTQVFKDQVKTWPCDLEGRCREQGVKKYTPKFST